MLGCYLYFLLSATTGTAFEQEAMSGRPTQVLSGERLILLGDDGKSYRVRLSGIITPPPNQGWGAAARRHLSALVMGRSITVYYRPARPGEEIRGHLFHGGSDVNIRLLQAGLARFDPSDLPEETAGAYAEAEHMARQSGAGIWRATPGAGIPGYRTIPGGPLFRIDD